MPVLRKEKMMLEEFYCSTLQLLAQSHLTNNNQSVVENFLTPAGLILQNSVLRSKLEQWLSFVYRMEPSRGSRLIAAYLPLIKLSQVFKVCSQTAQVSSILS